DVPVKPIKANVAFTAVPVPAGRHTIELRYVPRLFRTGLGVSLATLGVWVVAAGRIRMKWRSSSNEQGARCPVGSTFQHDQNWCDRLRLLGPQSRSQFRGPAG